MHLQLLPAVIDCLYAHMGAYDNLFFIHSGAAQCHVLGCALDMWVLHLAVRIYNVVFCDPFYCVLQGMDYELPESAMQQLRDVAGDVSMRFRCAAQQQCLLQPIALQLHDVLL
jgi:hypothetical protein